MKRNHWRLLMLALGCAAFVWGVKLRGYAVNQALISALSLVTLAYVCRRTYDELARVYRNACRPSWQVDHEPEGVSAAEDPVATASPPDSSPDPDP